MAQMVLGEEQPLVPVEVGRELFSSCAGDCFWNSFSLEPQRHRHAKRREAARRESEIGFEQPFEFQEWLVVEDDVIDIAER